MPVMGGRCSSAASRRHTKHKISESVTRIIGCPKDFDMERDSSGRGSLLRSRVGTCEFRAAGFLFRRKFHEFDARVVRVVKIKLPFAVAADLGLF